MEELEKKGAVVDTPVEPPVEATPSETPVAVAKSDVKAASEPNEAFFGSLLLFCLILSLIAAAGYFGFAGYRYFKQVQTENAIPSIESLPKPETSMVAKEEEKKESTEKTAETSTGSESSAAIDKKTLSVKVLNGGATKGVAGTYGEKLKAAGFTQTTVGNSVGDYTGQTLYYAKGQQAGADAIKAEVIKTYPKLVIKEAPTGDKDAALATYVLILGR